MTPTTPGPDPAAGADTPATGPCSDAACGHGPARAATLGRALGLEWLTVGWNVAEGAIAIAAAAAAGSVALFGFGLDSAIECASGVVLLWRLHAERTARDPADVARLDRVAHRGVGVTLFLLAAWVLVDATRALLAHERPGASPVGVALTTLSLLVMWVLARAKRRAARALGSRALAADAFQTTACFWLSAVTLAGLVLNAALGWWWADPVAALGMIPFLVAEGREAWRGEDCGCH